VTPTPDTAPSEPLERRGKPNKPNGSTAPLLGAERLSSAPALARALIVSPLSFEAATALLGTYVVLGASDPAHHDWALLANRQVDVWLAPDEREIVALIAAQLLSNGCKVRVIDCPTDAQVRTPAEAQFEDWDSKHTGRWLEDHAVNPQRPVTATASAPMSANEAWQLLELDCDHRGIPHPTIANAAAILSAHPQIKDRIWFDDFRGKVMQTIGGVDKPWTDAEDLQVCIWLQQALKIPKLGLQTALHAIHAVAFQRRRNPLTQWLESLKWDGTARLQHWIHDYLGAPLDDYSQAIGRNWLISMVARAFRPGCKVDHMPVLEGKMGRGKTHSLEILGGAWYKAAPQAFGSKEFFEVIQGAWLIEIPDMVGFGRREHSQIISAITTRYDSYRASYGRHASDHARTCVFAATSEDDEYLQDSRGIRRYWPLRCTHMEPAALSDAREQLFAEAVASFNQGATWHEMPEEHTRREQQQRVQIDPWHERIEAFVAMRSEVTVTDVAVMGLKMRLSDVGRAEQMRISNCLKGLGLACKVERIDSGVRRIYRR
jgi:hypothetical protein